MLFEALRAALRAALRIVFCRISYYSKLFELIRVVVLYVHIHMITIIILLLLLVVVVVVVVVFIFVVVILAGPMQSGPSAPQERESYRCL